MAHPPTLVMFPILIVIYHRLAAAEEKVVAARFGAAWDDYARRTPRFIPRLGSTPADLSPTDREVLTGHR